MTGAWPILGLSAHSPDIEAAVMPAADAQLENYGVTISRLGNLDVNLAEEDSARLKKLAGDTAYSRLAGGFLQAAQAEALQGAGEGMAQGGGAVTPMFLGAGLGMAGQMMQAPQQAPPYPPPPAPGFAGGGAGYAPPPQQAAPPQGHPQQAPPEPYPQQPAEQAAQAASLAAPAGEALLCTNCQAALRQGARFCDSCGTPTQAKCSNCQADLRQGARFCDACGTPTGAAPPAP
jgi:membrane protease subunit (stomatin/prohibitin family)